MTPTKRRILTVGAGAIVITALEGIACGNPVAPRCPGGKCHQVNPPADAAVVTPDAGVEPDAAEQPQ